MLKIWMQSTSLKSYRFHTWAIISNGDLIQAVYFIILASYFWCNYFQESAIANLVPERVVSERIDRAIVRQNRVNPPIYLPVTESRRTQEISLTAPVLLPISASISVADNALLIVPTIPTDRTSIALANPDPAIDPRYLIAPRQINLRTLNPTLTQFVINDVAVTHRTQFEVTGGTDIGDRSTTNPGINTTQLDRPEAQESVSSNRVYRFDYRSNYGQLRTLRQTR